MCERERKRERERESEDIIKQAFSSFGPIVFPLYIHNTDQIIAAKEISKVA